MRPAEEMQPRVVFGDISDAAYNIRFKLFCAGISYEEIPKV